MLFGYFRRQRNDYESIGVGVSGQIVIENEGSEGTLCIEGYTHKIIKSILFHTFAVAFAGIPYLFVCWYPQWVPKVKYVKCSLDIAEMLLIMDSNGEYFVENVTSSTFSNQRYFHFRCVKFVWDDNLQEFQKLVGLDNEKTMLSSLLEISHGISYEQQNSLLELFGENKIEIEVKSYWRLFFEEVLNPFYLFQIFSIVLWSLDDYYYYGGCVFFLSAVSIATSLHQTKKQSLALKHLVAASESASVQVYRNSNWCFIRTSDIVPGDLLLIPEHGFIVPCDALLLAGNCIVNESMLTGESVPVTKTPPPHNDTIYRPSGTHKKHTLFSGTHVIQTRYYGNDKVVALVIRTAFSTAKGELVRSMLFPRPMGFQFYSDSIKFVCVLFILAALGMIYCIYIFLERKASLETIVLRALDIITIVVPPALPAAMTAGTVYSQNRLQKLGIFCISPPRINMCGKLKLACFDKTGTLTEDGLDLYGVLSASATMFATTSVVEDPSKLPVTAPLLAAMATCHSLTRIEGKLTGDPLDLQMFHATKWELEEPGHDTTLFDPLAPTVVRPDPSCQLISDDFSELPLEIGIIRQFAFSSNEQCMSVIARTLGATHMTVYCKGAPEKIHSLCDVNSVPSDLGSVLMSYTSTGYRVIALAYKNLDDKVTWRQAQRIARDKIEVNLNFLGLLILRNMLKSETTPVIHQLLAARIRCVMITGDNLLTAVSVARDCGMVLPMHRVVHLKVTGANIKDEVPSLKLEVIGDTHDNNVECLSKLDLSTVQSDCIHFALDGHCWSVLRTYYPHIVDQVCRQGTVFARMSPEHKTQLVEELQGLDYIVAMCGDGANDCGALKAAHIGVSLSEAEASVAAPFTSRVANISCVLKLVQEGRCALVTSFGLFKYMALYSLIQFFTVLILYTRSSALGNMEFLYVDLVITTSLAIVMGRTGPATKLVGQRPMSSLVSLTNLIPLIIQIALTAFFQLAALYVLIQQPWFSPIHVSPDQETVVCWENTTVYCVSCFQYLILASVFSKGKPHRQSQYTNVVFVLTLVVLTAFTLLLLVYPFEPIAWFFELEPVIIDQVQQKFRLLLLLLPLTHLILAVIIEVFVTDKKWLKFFVQWLTRKKGPKNKYKRIVHNIEASLMYAEAVNVSV